MVGGERDSDPSALETPEMRECNPASKEYAAAWLRSGPGQSDEFILSKAEEYAAALAKRGYGSRASLLHLTASTYDLRDKRIKELRDQGRVETDYVATKDNKADMFTKCMSTKRSDYLLRLIDNRNWVQMQPGADWIMERLMMEDGNGS